MAGKRMTRKAPKKSPKRSARRKPHKAAPKAAPKAGSSAGIYVGHSEAAIRALCDGIEQILKASVGSPAAALSAIEALASIAKIGPTTISNCSISATDDGWAIESDEGSGT